MRWPWRRRKPTEVAEYEVPVIPFDPTPFKFVYDEAPAEPLRTAMRAMDDALAKHAESERYQINEMWFHMMSQPGPEKYGLLVETGFVESTDPEVLSFEVESTISLSPEIPFGEVRYRNKRSTT